MSDKDLQKSLINELLSTDSREKLARIIETIGAVQQGLYALYTNGDSAQWNLLKIGTVFQIFFINTLAEGKKTADLTEDDWKNIAEKVYQYAVIGDGQSYSEFVFTTYSSYIDVSTEVLQEKTSEKNIASIKEIAETIRRNTEKLHHGEITETAYIEACLWLSLEAMIKLLSASLTSSMASEYADLIQSVSQLAFEYGRYRLFKKEQEILERYIQNQYALDEQLKADYEAYLEEVREQADRFQNLVDEAFSGHLHELLLQSAELATEAGVKEEELLTSVEDIDAFFL